MGYGDIVDPQLPEFGQTPGAVAPQQDFATPKPPATPEELQQRISGWQNFLNRLQTDANVQKAAAHAAAALSNRKQGQSAWGNIAEAYSGAVDTYQAGVDADKAEKMKQEAFALTKQHTQQQMETARAEEERRKAGQPARLELEMAQAAKARAEAENIPAKLKLEAEVKRAELRAHQAVAAASQKNPTMQAAQTQFDLWAQSSEGARKAGETEEQWKMRGWDTVRSSAKDQNLGAVANTANAVAADILASPEEKAKARAVQMGVLGHTGKTASAAPAQVEKPIPPGYKSVADAEAAGLIYYNGLWLRKKAS